MPQILLATWSIFVGVYTGYSAFKRWGKKVFSALLFLSFVIAIFIFNLYRKGALNDD